MSRTKVAPDTLLHTESDHLPVKTRAPADSWFNYNNVFDDEDEEYGEEAPGYNQKVITLPLAIDPDPKWRALSLCKEHPEVSFFDDRQVSLAKAICALCPVIAQCGEFAAVNKEDFGVWGGLSATDRKELRRASRGVA